MGAAPLLAYLSLAASMALVGSYVGLSKLLVASFPVFLLAWLRFGIGGLAMWRWLRKPADEPPIDRRTRALLFLESFLGNFLFSICMLFGVRLTTAVAAGVVMSAIPAVVAILSWLFLRERIGRRTAAAIACAAVGIGLFSLQKVAPGAGAACPWTSYLRLSLRMRGVTKIKSSAFVSVRPVFLNRLPRIGTSPRNGTLVRSSRFSTS